MKYFILLLSGCLTACSAPVVDTVVQKFPPAAVPMIAPLALAPMQWQILNATDLQALATKMKGNKDFVLFALDAESYENFNLNMIDIKRYILQQKSVIILLKNITDQESGVVTTPPKITTK